MFKYHVLTRTDTGVTTWRFGSNSEKEALAKWEEIAHIIRESKVDVDNTAILVQVHRALKFEDIV